MSALLENTLGLLLDAAPWLTFGLIIAGLIHAWLPTKKLNVWLGQPGFRSVLKAAIIGTPLPLCSCSVVPVAMSLHRSGASRGATLSFMVSTPENGVDSITLSYALLGPFFTLVRPIAGISLAIAAGLAGEPLPRSNRAEPAPLQGDTPATSSCCGSQPATKTTTSCCSSTSQAQTSCCSGTPKTPARSFLGRGWEGIRYACSNLYADMVPWLALGVLLAGVVATFLPPELMTEWGSGPLAMLLMLVIGIPMYICATASTPLAAAFLIAGVSPGAVLVFLLAGPATNIGTLAIIRRELGTRAIAGYLAAISVGSIAFGLLTNALVELLKLDMQAQLASSEGHIPSFLAWGCAVLLILLAIGPLRRRLLGS